jgi:hypothetical protein
LNTSKLRNLISSPLPEAVKKPESDFRRKSRAPSLVAGWAPRISQTPGYGARLFIFVSEYPSALATESTMHRAMLAATASIALGGQNSDVVAEAADGVVLDSSLRRVDELIHSARRTRSIALQNAVGGMALSALGMGFAALGFLPPLVGAICQEIIDLAAVLNALRITLPQADMSDF